MPTTAVPDHLAPARIAARLGVSIDTVYRAIHDHDPAKRLPAVKVRGQYRVSEADLAAWLARQPSNTPPAEPNAPAAVARHPRRPARRQRSARAATARGGEQ